MFSLRFLLASAVGVGLVFFSLSPPSSALFAFPSPVSVFVSGALVTVTVTDEFDLYGSDPTACGEGPIVSGFDDGKCFGGNNGDNGPPPYSYVYTVSPTLVTNSVEFHYATFHDTSIECNPDGTIPSGSDNRVAIVECNTCYIDAQIEDAFQIDCGGTIQGDPEFTGFLGQSYQVHGTSGTVYNILSTPTFQYNALFTYLDSGKPRKGTQPYSHPGNYFGSVGISIKDRVSSSISRIEIISGPVGDGLVMRINNSTVIPDDFKGESSSSSTSKFAFPIRIGDYSIRFPTAFDVELESDEFSLRISNSDMFLNQDISIGTRLAKQIQQHKQIMKSPQNGTTTTGVTNEDVEWMKSLPHGILGQTWNRATYNNRWKYIEGQLFDYAIEDNDLFGNNFKYNRF